MQSIGATFRSPIDTYLLFNSILDIIRAEGPFKLKRETLGESRRCHQITQGGGRGLTKMSGDIFAIS